MNDKNRRSTWWTYRTLRQPVDKNSLMCFMNCLSNMCAILVGRVVSLVVSHKCQPSQVLSLVHIVTASSSTHAARQTTLVGSISDLDQNLFTDENNLAIVLLWTFTIVDLPTLFISAETWRKQGYTLILVRRSSKCTWNYTCWRL